VVFGRMVRTACNIEGEATKLDAILVLKVMRLDVQDNQQKQSYSNKSYPISEFISTFKVCIHSMRSAASSPDNPMIFLEENYVKTAPVCIVPCIVRFTASGVTGVNGGS